MLVEHVVEAQFAGQAPGVLQLHAAETLRLAVAGEVFVEEGGVVHAQAAVGLEGAVGTAHGVVLEQQGRRQLLDVGQLAVQARAEALDVDLVVERSGGDQFHAPLVGEHVGEGQAELGVAVDSRLGTALLGAVQLDVGTAVVGIDGGEAATDDEVTGLVSLNIRSGERGGDGEGQQGSGKPGLTHDELHSLY